jgi:signal transduction histidine kinase
MDDKLLLVFADNGAGIDLLKHKDSIFGLYKRFNNKIEGKGLGMFMVKTQVETLGGKIQIHSEIGVGTEIQIEFEVNHSHNLIN